MRYKDYTKMKEKIKWDVKWILTKYENDAAFERGECYQRVEFENNLLLNEGIQLMLDLLIGGGGTVFSNANAYIGVGDDTTAAAATQTGLQAATNKAYVGMEATYPQRTGQTVTFRSVFGSSVGNFSWQEFTIANGSSDAAVNLNRKVEDQGAKVSGQTWTLDAEITIS